MYILAHRQQSTQHAKFSNAARSRQVHGTYSHRLASMPDRQNNRPALFSRSPLRIQAKLAVNTPGDRYETEADRIAEQIMRKSEVNAKSACACGGTCPKCQSQQRGQTPREQTPIAGAPQHSISSDGMDSVVSQAIRHGGQPLEPALRTSLEATSGLDLSRVRVHTGEHASRATRGLSARAFTLGRDIVFDQGEYAPGTRTGQRLLAHELAHVAQQGYAQPLMPDRSAATHQSLDTETPVRAVSTDASRRHGPSRNTILRGGGPPPRCLALGCGASILRPAHGGMCGLVNCTPASTYRGWLPFGSPGSCLYRCPDGAYCGGVLTSVFWGAYRGMFTVRCFSVVSQLDAAEQERLLASLSPTDSAEDATGESGPEPSGTEIA